MASPSWEPLGFARMPVAIGGITWHKDGTRILVACANGTVAEMMAPTASLVRENRTFERADLELRSYTFVSVRARLDAEKASNSPDMPKAKATPKKTGKGGTTADSDGQETNHGEGKGEGKGTEEREDGAEEVVKADTSVSPVLMAW